MDREKRLVEEISALLLQIDDARRAHNFAYGKWSEDYAALQDALQLRDKRQGALPGNIGQPQIRIPHIGRRRDNVGQMGAAKTQQ